MKKAIVFPSFWARPAEEGIKKTDFYYDHPLPVNQEGWLPRCFESLRTLKNQDFEVIVVAGANTPEVADEAEEKMQEIVKKYSGNIETSIFSYSEFDNLTSQFKDEFEGLLSMTGYSDLRNLCLVAANLRDVDLAISIDDDVVFHEKDWLSKIEAGIDKTHNGTPINALGGPYLHGDLELMLETEKKPWALHWNSPEAMNRMFQEYIVEGERYRTVPFAIMGNIAVTKDFYKKVPLDPAMRRGEDSDWAFNALMLDERFVMDTEMPVHHRPPERPHPKWRSMREDIARFLYQRKKYRTTKEQFPDFPELETFQPFPGEFWTDELEEKIREGCKLLAMDYLSRGREDDAQETLHNYYLAETEYSNIEENPTQTYLDYQSRWVKLMEWIDENRGSLRSTVW